MNHASAPNIANEVSIAGLDKIPNDGAIKDEATVAQVLEQHFGFESGREALEHFKQVCIAAADGEGSYNGPHANNGASKKDAYEAGSQELNRMLTRIGWKSIGTGHKKLSMSKEKSILILYKNVKNAGDLTSEPKGISECGSETTNLVCSDTDKTGSCDPLEVWFLCVEIDENGGINIELSLPKPYVKRFKGFHIRMIVMSNRSDNLISGKQMPLDDSLDDVIDEPSVELR